MATSTYLRGVRWLSLLSTAVTLGVLTTHVLKLPNKLALDGPLWLAIQQDLYRGWDLFIGSFEVTAIAASWAWLGLVRKNRSVFSLTLLAALLLSGAQVTFFALNAPVNAAFASWTAANLPPD